ncbi:MAG: hypothetical protein AMXMBFR84_38210 [Candidatus Hydrogenedentota bacterium]
MSLPHEFLLSELAIDRARKRHFALGYFSVAALVLFFAVRFYLRDSLPLLFIIVPMNLVILYFGVRFGWSQMEARLRSVRVRFGDRAIEFSKMWKSEALPYESITGIRIDLDKNDSIERIVLDANGRTVTLKDYENMSALAEAIRPHGPEVCTYSIETPGEDYVYGPMSWGWVMLIAFVLLMIALTVWDAIAFSN